MAAQKRWAMQVETIKYLRCPESGVGICTNVIGQVKGLYHAQSPKGQKPRLGGFIVSFDDVPKLAGQLFRVPKHAIRMVDHVIE